MFGFVPKCQSGRRTSACFIFLMTGVDISGIPCQTSRLKLEYLTCITCLPTYISEQSTMFSCRKQIILHRKVNNTLS
ncbi:hypothetical protein DEU56DRAFT_423836 [Suillus clintonianus]|uniref:uncharacterized protein n=1 Tax=Suillus clintonianus TaxID=1904413 RepID=UPI001B85FADD|nr:uncharacterized protein DEU56DRAFT_423836 [Suillus clintonianus]KAG2133003.1 hypothetical protein DEU56DRAFT_423836 [Suillus clintonianus]